MHKIELHGTLCISADLESRLRSRGLLSASRECTEDFIYYIQECIARDDSRCSILAEKSFSETSLTSAVHKTVVAEDVEESGDESLFQDESEEKEEEVSVPAESKSSSLQNSLSSLVDESDLAALRQGLSTLYQGG